ncbi:hypothetical protein B0O80DRAFT_495651 [Mortierella sp. GBAus27b]|nr:hypothetical protein B0O80DRAFT_495651 [Mortierella sp. GBAus27b]
MAADGKPAQPSTGTLGISGLWTRHPIIEGVRRNHSLIKVVLDTTTTGTSTSTSTPAATVTPTTPLAAPGAGAGAGAGAAGAGAKSNRTPVEESRMSRDNGRSGAITASAAQELYYSQQELQHLQMQQQQMLQKKILTNRKLLRERGRVGWEELKLLGVDDDVIREVCQDI